MLLLGIVFRSVVVPVKAAVMNLLSIAAAYGVVTAIFQWGWGAGLLGLDHSMPVSSWLPILLFAVLFGLSMDYEVFLLSRIREDWLDTGDASGSVVRGLASTGRVISAAAAIMVAVFLGFASEVDVVVKQLGVGMAVAITLDATLVRMVLVPATMTMLGRWNWWMPAWLDRLVPVLEVDAPSDHHRRLPHPHACRRVNTTHHHINEGAIIMSTTTQRHWPTQLFLPGQAAAPDGPVDMQMMYVMHHAFRRDLAKFASAAQHTPVEDRATWRLLESRVGRSSPTSCTTTTRARTPGSGRGCSSTARRPTARRWRRWRPSTRRSTRRWPRAPRASPAWRATPTTTPGRRSRCAWSRRGSSLARHLAHEETDAMAILQRLMTPEEWAALDEEFFKQDLEFRRVVALVPWAAYGLPREVLDRVFADTGIGFKLVWLATRVGSPYERSGPSDTAETPVRAGVRRLPRHLGR